MPRSPADVKLVSNAMANATRRKIMAKLVESSSTKEGIAKVAGASMLDYHLQMLQQAGLADINENTVSYIGSAEGHEYPDLQVGDEVNPRPFFMPLLIDKTLLLLN
jgi:hypothetical protein